MERRCLHWTPPTPHYTISHFITYIFNLPEKWSSSWDPHLPFPPFFTDTEHCSGNTETCDGLPDPMTLHLPHSFRGLGIGWILACISSSESLCLLYLVHHWYPDWGPPLFKWIPHPQPFPPSKSALQSTQGFPLTFCL